MENQLKKEFEFYKENQEKLVSKYEGRFIVIKNAEVIGVYDLEIDAYNETQKSHKLGSFLIQHVTKGDDSYSQTFYSRVSV